METQTLAEQALPVGAVVSATKTAYLLPLVTVIRWSSERAVLQLLEVINMEKTLTS